MSAPQPVNTSEELTEAEMQLIVALQAGASYDKARKAWIVTEADMGWFVTNNVPEYVADHDAKRYAALEALPEEYDDWPTDMQIGYDRAMEHVRKVFNMKEEADGDTK